MKDSNICVWGGIYKLDIMPNNANSKSAHGDKVTVIMRIVKFELPKLGAIGYLTFKVQNLMYLIKLNPHYSSNFHMHP